VSEHGQVFDDGEASWPQTGAGRSLATTGLIVVLVLAVAVTVYAVATRATHPRRELLRVDSGSMRPTLAIGQFVTVDTSAYASAVPRVGDIVAFHAPTGATGEEPVCGVTPPAGQVCMTPTPTRSDQIFIKRVVAAPGDTIAVFGGSVVRNGRVQREAFKIACRGVPECNFPISAQVPPGDWFLMGDDRRMSNDSRYWGPVPQAWIIGKIVR
jgi:signal peptidase I